MGFKLLLGSEEGPDIPDDAYPLGECMGDKDNPDEGVVEL